MTDFDRRSFMGSLAALFAGFRIKGTPEHELVKATVDFLEAPEPEEEEDSSGSSESSSSTSGSSPSCHKPGPCNPGCRRDYCCYHRDYEQEGEAESQ